MRIRTFFRWCERQRFVDKGTYQTLLTLAGLEEDAPDVRDPGDVLPVAEEVVEATLPHLTYVVQALVQVQLWTGARPGEVVKLRPCDLRREASVELAPGFVLETNGVWVYHPEEHKTRHRGHQRVILFGPKAQEVLAPFLLGRTEDAYLFSPKEAVENYYRATGRRINHGQGRKPGSCYTVSSYNKAIDKACDRAGVERWHPNQLRHLQATRIVRQWPGAMGWELARIILGHKHVSMVRTYALDDLGKAAEAVAQVG